MSSVQIDSIARLLDERAAKPAADMKLALSRLSVEITARTSNSSAASFDFLVSAADAISKLTGQAHIDLRLKCLFDAGLYFYRLGFARPAVHTADVVQRLARRTTDKIWLRKANTLSGIVQSEIGNIADAVVHYSEALHIAREIGDASGEVAVLINLASAFNYGTLHAEAIKVLNRAIDLATGPSLSLYRATIYCDIAQAYLALEEFNNGFAAIEKSLENSDTPADGPSYFSRTIREYTYVQLALEVGKLARAREHATACSRYGQWGDNSRSKTLAQIALGLCEIRGGNVERGLSYLNGALVTSGDFIVSRVDVLNALVKAYDEIGQPEHALRYMNEMLSFVRRVRGQSVEALMSVRGSPPGSSLLNPNVGDVKSLELREARLRAKVAEHELINAQLEMFERLAITADLREEPTGQHGYRVGRLSALCARRLGFAGDAIRDFELVARLHDIGKVAVPERILSASTNLKSAERALMQAHAVIGAELLGRSHFQRLQLAEQIARHHHEWWDGTGYPSKLSGKRIPIHARIVALADVFDALTHGRPYAPAWPIDKALEEIRQRRGTQFDPELTDTFLALIDELRSEHADLDAFLAEASRNSPFLQARDKIRLMLEGGRQSENMAAAAAETVH